MTEAFTAVPGVDLRALPAQAVAGAFNAERRSALLERYGDLVGGT